MGTGMTKTRRGETRRSSGAFVPVRFSEILTIGLALMCRFLFAVLIFAALLAGCAQAIPLQPSEPLPASVEATALAPTLQPSTPTTSQPTAPAPIPTSPPSSPAIAPAPLESSTPSVQSSAPSLVLKVTTPQDESIVNVASVDVAGTTIPGAVVSVNGQLADVDPSGKFRLTLALDEGPNVLEVVASDDSGNQVYTILTVIYEP
jgi:glucodextranase-like protein